MRRWRMRFVVQCHISEKPEAWAELDLASSRYKSLHTSRDGILLQTIRLNVPAFLVIVQKMQQILIAYVKNLSLQVIIESWCVICGLRRTSSIDEVVHLTSFLIS